MLGLPEDKGLEGVFIGVIEGLAEKDPQRAMRCVEAISDEDERDKALPYLVSGWTKNDPAAAARWVETLPKDKFQYVAMSLLGQWLFTGDESSQIAAKHWVDQLPDEEMRHAAMFQYLVLGRYFASI